MARMQDSGTPPGPDGQPAWRTCLDFDSPAADHYADYVMTDLFGLFAGEPRRVLELGCAGGAFGAELKKRFPAATVVGIDAARAAAERAATRLDRVVHARLDGLDFAAAGFAPGEFDTVVAVDILEHLVNPWDLLVRLKPFLRPGGQVLASIPNVRNLTVVSRLLLEGTFEYAERGLLDVTHLRFFTLEGMRRMFGECGYRVEEARALLLPAMEQLHAGFSGKSNVTVRVGRMTVENVTSQEVTEFCASQFLLRCRPA